MNILAGLHDFIDAVPGPVRQAIEAAGSERTIPAGRKLLRAGHLPHAVYQIRKGRVRYCAWDHQGREQVLTYMGDGDWVGLSEIFTRLPAQWDVVAETECHLRLIRQNDFENLVDTQPALAKQLLRTFATRFSLYRLFGLAGVSSLEERVVKMLWFLSYGQDKSASDDVPIALELSQTRLARVVGASRQKLNPILKALERRSLLSLHVGVITLRSRDALRQQYPHWLDLVVAPRP